MHKMELQMFFACPTHSTMMLLLRGGPINHFQNPFALTPDKSAVTMRPSKDSFFGMSYSATSNSNSSTAPLPKQELTVSQEALKTLDAPLAATCAKIIEDRNLFDFYQYLALTAPSITIPNS